MDRAFYDRLVEAHGGPLLELACGTGRICLPIAARGVETTGLDSSKQMIAWTRKRADELGIGPKLHVADMRDFELPGKYSLILLTYNSFNHLHTRSDIVRCLRSVRRHMKDESHFVIDTFNPNPQALHLEETEPVEILSFREPVTSKRLVLLEQNRYEPASQLNHVTWRFQAKGYGDLRVEHLEMRVFFPQELDALLEWNGFEIDLKLGDYDENPFESNSPKQLVICHGAE